MVYDELLVIYNHVTFKTFRVTILSSLHYEDYLVILLKNVDTLFCYSSLFFYYVTPIF